MTRISPLTRALAVVLAAALTMPGCAMLRDRDAFETDAVTISQDPDTGEISVEPEQVFGNWHYGKVYIDNQTGENHGFAIDELAIYDEIPRGTARIVNISDAQDQTTYVFYCHLHDPSGQQGTEYRGELVIAYSEKEGL